MARESLIDRRIEQIGAVLSIGALMVMLTGCSAALRPQLQHPPHLTDQPDLLTG